MMALKINAKKIAAEKAKKTAQQKATKEKSLRVTVSVPRALAEDFEHYLSINKISSRKRSREVSIGLNRLLDRSYWLRITLERTIDLGGGTNPLIAIMLPNEDAERITEAIAQWDQFRGDPEACWISSDPESKLMSWERIIELKQSDILRMAIMVLCYPELTVIER